MYYRVAIQVDPAGSMPTWRWQSTTLGTLNAVLQWLRWYQNLPRERMCVFSSSSRETLDDVIRRANQGLGSTAVPATRLVPVAKSICSTSIGEPHIAGQLAVQSGGARGIQERRLTTSVGNQFQHRPLLSSPLEWRRDVLERGAGGDHDPTYRFSLPASAPERLAWVKLLARVRKGDLQFDVAPPPRPTAVVATSAWLPVADPNP
jgi:hypothetical protein